MPPRALAKTHLPNSSETRAFLIDRIGLENLEQQYGGTLSPPENVREYIEQGYWDSHRYEKIETPQEEYLNGIAVEL